jgi:hypothetical protein
MHWEGSCPDASIREDLSRRLLILAKEAHRHFPPEEPFRHWKGIAKGPVYVHPSLAGLPVPPGPGLEIRSVLEKYQPPAPPNPVKIPFVHLHGVEFRLPHNLYSHEDRISMVFAFQDRDIHLPWKLVQVEDHAQCQNYSPEEIRNANMLLVEPSIHLRYYGEEWLPDFLGWIKHYCIPDLMYWGYEQLPRYSLYSMLDPHNRRERDMVWKSILEDFRQLVGKPAR